MKVLILMGFDLYFYTPMCPELCQNFPCKANPVSLYQSFDQAPGFQKTAAGIVSQAPSAAKVISSARILPSITCGFFANLC